MIQPDNIKQLAENKQEDLTQRLRYEKSNDNSVNQVIKLHNKQQTKVQENKKQHKCSLCGYTSFRKFSLKTHIESVHKGNKPHKCSICDYATTQKRHLKRHIESVHEGKKSFKSDI